MAEARTLMPAKASGLVTNAAKSSVEQPRLLYLGDVPVEASYHGSALLYRLLQTYPADRLTIIEAGIEASKPERRVAGVAYHALLLPLSRLQTTRFAPWYTVACLRTAGLRAGRLQGLARACRAEAILTVTHGNSWITAAELARRLDLPLHLICHDEWARAGAMQAWKDRVFGTHYRRAASRLCVSPFMAERYMDRFGAPAEVLYPARGTLNKAYPAPPEEKHGNGGIVGAFAGASLHDAGNRAALQHVARCLTKLGGRLVIFGPFGDEHLPDLGLAGFNVTCMGLIKESMLVDELRSAADFLVAPMSFLPSDRDAVQTSFPSKLTEYTAAALPILALAPPYASLAAWCRLEPDAALLVTEQGDDSISAAISRLLDPATRYKYGVAGATVGARYFDASVNSGLLLSALRRGTVRAR